MKTVPGSSLVVALCALVSLFHPGVVGATLAKFSPAKPVMQQYTKAPLTAGASTPALVMLLLDTSKSMNFNAHQTVDSYGFHTGTGICRDTTKKFYGYFDPEQNYALKDDISKNKQYWAPSTGSGTTGGSELNCLYMRRIDIARKALTGGRLATTEEITIPSGKTMLRTEGGRYVLIDEERVSGMLQAIDGKVRLGLTILDYTNKGGIVVHPVSKYPSENTAEIIATINNVTPWGGSPLAEALWTIRGYFTQKKEGDSDSGPRYYSDSHPKSDQIPEILINNAWTRFGATADVPELIPVSYSVGGEWDPFYDKESKKRMDCSSKAVVIISDGESMLDVDLPGDVKDADEDGDITAGFGGEKVEMSTFLDDVAFLLNKKDSSAADPINREMTLDVYTLFLYGDARDDKHYFDIPWDGAALLKDTAENTEKGLATRADSGDEIVTALQDVFGAVNQGEASGGAVATGIGRGAGAVYQGMYRPSMDAGVDLVSKERKTVSWVGDVQALLTDGYGNLREDTNGNQKLDMKEDYIVKLVYDGTVTVAERFWDKNGSGVSKDAVKVDTKALDEVAWLWSAQSWLKGITSPLTQGYKVDNGRYLFTSIDGAAHPFTTGEMGDFWEYFLNTGATLGSKDLNNDGEVNAEDAQILVEYIRGVEHTGLRSRNVDGHILRLGDIINSSPVMVQSPADNYDIRYNDGSYRAFKRKYANRRTMVYVGGNDGIFHAFNGGFFVDRYLDDKGTPDINDDVPWQNKFWRALDEDGKPSDTGLALGQEMWGYVPQNLLPHLLWLAQEKYDHIYYNDLKPRVFDAKLWGTGDDVHVGGWGTLLIGGMRFGGGPIEVTVGGVKKIMRSAYYIFDITDPEQKPVLLDEFTVDDEDRFSFTTVYPAIVPVKREVGGKAVLHWYFAVGNGPTSLRGESDQKGAVLIRKFVDQISSTTTSIWDNGETRIVIDEENSFISDPYAVDLQRGTNVGAFSTDALYFGSVSGSFTDEEAVGGSWSGKMYRLWISGREATAPENPELWQKSVFFDAEAPISTAPLMSLDNGGTPWLYFGTGRLFDLADENNKNQQSFYAVKEIQLKSGRFQDDSIDGDTLANISTVKVASKDKNGDEAGSAAEALVENYGLVNSFAGLKRDISGKSGWKMDFADTGERLLATPSIFAGVLLFTGFVPGEDMCDTMGTSNIYLRYYTTGTAFWKPIASEEVDADNSGKISVHGRLGEAGILFGDNGTATAVFKSDDAAIPTVKLKTPLPFRSHRISWKDWIGDK